MSKKNDITWERQMVDRAEQHSKKCKEDKAKEAAATKEYKTNETEKEYKKNVGAIKKSN